ncbi:MAG: hypothetical protein QOE70_1477 [Chthoniobacter sp.]|nr:hypothetical protein [Chthoniobacter sp.]
MFPSLCGLRLVGTTRLLDWATRGDAHIENLHGAFVRGGSIILDYTTFPQRGNNGSFPGARYWAVLPLPPPREKSPQYQIHRRPITPSDIEGAKPIPVVDLRGHVPTDPAWDRMEHAQVIAFMRTRFNPGQPAIYFYRASYRSPGFSDTFTDGNLYIQFTDPTSGTMEIFSNHPSDTYIPFSRRLVLLVCWPFAVVVDWITAPLIPFVPKW